MEIPLGNLFIEDKVTRDFIATRDMIFDGHTISKGTVFSYDLKVGNKTLKECIENSCTVVLANSDTGLIDVSTLRCPN